jgi:hypothetical protein
MYYYHPDHMGSSTFLSYDREVFSPEKNGVILNPTKMKEPSFARIGIDLVDLVNKKNDSIKIILLILVFKVFDETIDKF